MNLLDNSRGRWKMIIMHRRSYSIWNWMCAFSFLNSGPWGNQRVQSPVEYRGNMYVPSICPSVHPPPSRGPFEAHPGLLDVQMDGWMDRWSDGTYRFPLYSAELCPLWLPQWPLTCLHNSYHHEIPEQGKGTNDLWATGYFSVEGSHLSSWLSISCSATDSWDQISWV